MKTLRLRTNKILHEYENRIRSAIRLNVLDEVPDGCGNWGCLYTTTNRDVLLKITTDPSEAQFVDYLLRTKLQFVGMVNYASVFEIDATGFYVITREIAYHVGNTPNAERIDKSKDAYQFMKNLMNFSATAHHFREAIRPKKMNVYVENRGTPQDILERCGMMAAHMAHAKYGHFVGEAFSELLHRDILLTSVHSNNIGQDVERNVIITDPGHAIALRDGIFKEVPKLP